MLLRKKPAHLLAVTDEIAARRANTFCFRRAAFNTENAFSMGLKSGEYGGVNAMLKSRADTTAWMRFEWWNATLSIINTALGSASKVLIKFSKIEVLQEPLNEEYPTTPLVFEMASSRVMVLSPRFLLL
jgi:hypothetical protein